MPSLKEIINHEIDAEIYKAQINGASIRFLAVIIGTDEYGTVYKAWTHGGNRSGDKSYIPLKAGRPSKEDLLDIEAGLPTDHPLRLALTQRKISLKRWCNYYGLGDPMGVLSSCDSEEIAALLDEDFPEATSAASTREYRPSPVRPVLAEPSFKKANGVNVVEIGSKQFPGVKAFGQNLLNQTRYSTRLVYMVFTRERLKAFNSNQGSIEDRINAALNWKPDQKMFREYRYEVPEWISNKLGYFEECDRLKKAFEGFENELLQQSSRGLEITEEDDILRDTKKAAYEAYKRENAWMVPKTVAFSNPLITNFWQKCCETVPLAPLEADIIAEILSLLDKDGNCPSVVDKLSESKEDGSDSNSYEKLAKITLTRHSINVAARIVRNYTAKSQCGFAIIAALAHDIGKIVGHCITNYHTESHPELGVKLLKKMVYFKNHPKKTEIVFAIIKHHSKEIIRYENKEKITSDVSINLAMNLRKSDADSRAYEMEQVGLQL